MYLFYSQISKGWPTSKTKIPSIIAKYWQIKDCLHNLYCDNSIFVYAFQKKKGLVGRK